MTTIDDLLEDIDIAFERLLASSGDETPELRRALRDVLSAVYEVRCHVEDEWANARGDRSAYSLAARNDPLGQVAEGVIVIRGRLTHGAMSDIRPLIAPAYPGAKLFPGPYTFPGANLSWLELDEIDEPARSELLKRDNKHHLYRDHVAGHMVLGTLDATRQFFRAQCADRPWA